MGSTMNVENVVASTKLADEFDLYKIEAELEGAEYKKEKFPGLVYRVKAPKAAFLIFTSGKIVCTGAKNIEDIRRVIITLAETLKSIGIENIYSEPEIIVQNIVATADFKVDLNLNAVVLGMGMENVEYEPEQFPGVVCRVGGEGGDLHICPSVRIQYRLVGCILRLEVSLLRIDSDSAALADDTADHIQVLAGLEERRPAARPIHPLGELCHGSELQHNGAQSISLAQKS